MTNPAIKLYNAWDSIFQANRTDKSLSSLKEHFPRAFHLDNRPRQQSRRYLFQLLDWKVGISPVCLDEQDQFVYALGYVNKGSIQESLFYLDAQGRFSFGDAFYYGYTTWGKFSKLTSMTFMAGGMTNGRGNCFWFGTDAQGDRQRWLNVRDWRLHHYYFRQRRHDSDWYELDASSGTWMAQIAPDQEGYSDSHDRLLEDYRAAEAYYAKWRKRYFKKQGIPDPKRKLDASSIETVNYLTQHLKVYEPAKARLLSQ